MKPGGSITLLPGFLFFCTAFFPSEYNNFEGKERRCFIIFKIGAYYTGRGVNTGSYSVWIEQREKLAHTYPAWLEVDGAGMITGWPAFELRSEMKEFSIIPLVSIRNFSREEAEKFLLNPKAQKKARDELKEACNALGWNGINLDIEGVAPHRRKNFNDLVEYFAEEPGFLSLSVPAKTADSPDHPWSGAYDYKALGQLAGEIIIMAYDFHYPGGPPGPVAPLPWVEEVLRYAQREIPEEKIRLGLPGYGYHWPEKGRASGVSYHQIKKLADRESLKRHWCPESSSPFLIRGRERIWYEDKESLKKKIELGKNFCSGGVLWRLGLEDPRFWEYFWRRGG